MNKMPKWMIYAGIGMVIVIAYTFLSPAPTIPTRTSSSAAIGGTAAKKGDELYRPEDYTARFPGVNVAPRDAFKPLVVKTSTTLTGQVTPLLPNGIPASFAGGDGNWIYTGNAEVNGVPNALLENPTTEEGVFLRPGEHWRGLTLAGVSENSIDLIGPTGQRRSVRIADDSLTDVPMVATNAPPVTPPGTLPGVAPNGRSPLTGQIGIDPNARNPGLDGSQNPGAGQDRTNRRNRGNRRNNRTNANSPAGSAGPTFGNP